MMENKPVVWMLATLNTPMMVQEFDDGVRLALNVAVEGGEDKHWVSVRGALADYALTQRFAPGDRLFIRGYLDSRIQFDGFSERTQYFTVANALGRDESVAWMEASEG